MDCFRDVIDAFGGPAKFAAAVGIKPFHAQTMKTRGSIPPAYWERVVNAGHARSIDIGFEALSRMAARRADHPPPPTEGAAA